MDLNLKNKFAIVTGNSRGIGKAITDLLREEGCEVPDISRSTGYDLMTEEGVNKLLKDYPKCDILVNSVGGGGRWGKEIFEETELNVWEDVFQKNAGIAVILTMNYLSYMTENNWGRVVTVSSIFGYEAGGKPWFNIAKAAQISLMKTLSKESRYVTRNITFNTIAPGFIMIENTGWEKMKNEEPEKFKEIIKQLPMQRLGTVQEIANAVVFLCSDRASLVNGACINVDGAQSHSFITI